MICSIHQPNFFPHQAFFDKMKKADVFVLLTNCQFEKNGFQNRFRMEEQWNTMRVGKGNIPIAEKKYISPYKDWEIIKNRLPGRELELYDGYINKDLTKTNIGIIKRIAKLLRIETVLVRDYKTHLTGTERLIDLCKKFGCGEYLSGPSGADYMNMQMFEDAHIKVTFQEKTPTVPILEVL